MYSMKDVENQHAIALQAEVFRQRVGVLCDLVCECHGGKAVASIKENADFSTYSASAEVDVDGAFLEFADVAKKLYKALVCVRDWHQKKVNDMLSEMPQQAAEFYERFSELRHASGAIFETLEE